MSKTIKLSQGYDIPLLGEALRFNKSVNLSRNFAIKPTDFKGIIPKLSIEVGQEIKAGDVLFYSKQNESIKFVSPVSGEISEIKRGDRRVIQEIVIISDSKNSYKDFGKANPSDLNSEAIKSKILDSGAWTFIKQRPFNKIADPNTTPKAIFISGFDSAPNGVDYNHIVKGQGEDFQTGINALAKLTSGKVNLNLSKRLENAFEFTNCKNVEITNFDGPHPAGNVGVQIHHLNPTILKSDLVWTVNPQDVIIIGRLFNKGIFDASKLIALAGSPVIKHNYFTGMIGMCVNSLIDNNLNEKNVRVISGNLLTGTKINSNDYLGYYDNLVSVIKEGDHEELFGWLIPTYPRPSLSNTFPFNPDSQFKYDVNTNMHGEERAFVVTGDYEKVLPMDIMPLHLIKACMANNYEEMEALGIYEVDPEDFALCEFICTSKAPIQEILTKAINNLEIEG